MQARLWRCQRLCWRKFRVKNGKLRSKYYRNSQKDKVDTIEKINRKFTKIKKNKPYTRDYEI